MWFEGSAKLKDICCLQRLFLKQSWRQIQGAIVWTPFTVALMRTLAKRQHQVGTSIDWRGLSTCLYLQHLQRLHVKCGGLSSAGNSSTDFTFSRSVASKQVPLIIGNHCRKWHSKLLQIKPLEWHWLKRWWTNWTVVEKTRNIRNRFHQRRSWSAARGEFSFSGSKAISNWGPFYKVCDDWCHTNQHLHVLVTFTEQIVTIPKHITLFWIPSI